MFPAAWAVVSYVTATENPRAIRRTAGQAAGTVVMVG